MATFSEALAEIRSSTLSQAEKGARFERLILQLFREDPLYRQEYKRVWLWHDWPDRRSRDLGIDLVAERADGSGYAAIQCKCYDEGASVSKQEVDAFLAASAKRGFTARFFITTGALSGTPLKQLTDPRNHPSVSILYTQDLNERDFHWALLGELEESTRYTGGKFTPRPDQTKAIRSTLGKLYGHWRVPDEWEGARPGNRQPVEALNKGDDRIYDRGQVLMPCGTGKTFTSLKIAEQAAERERERERELHFESCICCPASRSCSRPCGNGRSKKPLICGLWGCVPMSAQAGTGTRSVISRSWRFR